MSSRWHGFVRGGVAIMILAGAVALTNGGAGTTPAGAGGAAPRPIVFVHGYFGSGAQFETQAKRFASNGYPAARISMLDYDTSFAVETTEQIFARLDQLIDTQLTKTGADRVDLLAHSLGTRLMQEYLRSSPDRAARVAHYVNLDGFPSLDEPGGVPTLAVWGRGNSSREIAGAQNLHLDDQTHVEVVTSRETFAALYEFFTGDRPETTKIVPQRDAEISGRAVLFPQNVGVDGGRLDIYEVDADSGVRLTAKPTKSFPLRGDGAWGPFTARGGTRYEFAIVRSGAAVHHLYYEPFLRTDHWVRLLTSPTEGGIGSLLNVGDDHASITIVRYKEWWGDQGVEGDTLSIDGQSILTPTNAPIDKRAIALFVFDEEGDGATDLAAPMPAFAPLPFITGMDVFVPASDPPDDTIRVVSTPRGGRGRTVALDIPSWPSSTDRVSLQFSDHLQGTKAAR